VATAVPDPELTPGHLGRVCGLSHRPGAWRQARGLSGEAHLAQVPDLLDAERAAIYHGWTEGRTLAQLCAAAGITARRARPAQTPGG